MKKKTFNSLSYLIGYFDAREGLKNSIDLLRSVYQVVMRNGRDTNWKALEKQIKKELDIQQDINSMKIKTEEVKDGELLSNCCAWDFDPLGFEKEEGIWQERCLKCGKLCEPLFISNRDIENIRRCKEMEGSTTSQPEGWEKAQVAYKIIGLVRGFDKSSYEDEESLVNMVNSEIRQLIATTRLDAKREERGRLKSIIWKIPRIKGIDPVTGKSVFAFDEKDILASLKDTHE